MAIKRGSKIDSTTSAASMTDLMFLLLIFLMIATTLINSNAVQLALPKSTSPVQDKPATSISITSDLQYFLDERPVSASELEGLLQAKLTGQENPVVYLYADKRVSWETVVDVMNIAKRNNYKLNAGTIPE